MTATDVHAVNELALAGDGVELSFAQKAAVLVLALGQDVCAPVLSRLGERELEELSIEVARLGSVTPELSAAVVEEFLGSLEDGHSGSARGGMDAARMILAASLGAERAASIAEKVENTFIDLPFASLQTLDPRQVVSFLVDEHPQTIALVLAHLPAESASRVLAGMSRDLQADVAHRIAVMDQTSPDLIRQVESSLERRLSSLGVRSEQRSKIGGLRPLVDIINRAGRAAEKEILEGLAEKDADLAERVRAQMFTFEDIASLDDRSVQLIVRQVPMAELALALKGVPDRVRTKVMSNMSERAAGELVEEIDLLGPVRVAQVEEAQSAAVRVVRTLEESGEIILERGEADVFVG